MTTKNESYKIKLGLFVLGGLSLFIIGVFIIGRQKHLFDPVFKIRTTFYNVSGLQVGNNVRFSGINVGTVSNILIVSDSSVQVEMLIKQNVQPFIKLNSIVGVGSEGIIGDRILIISQGSTDSPMVKKGQELSSTEPIEIDAIISSIEISALNVEIVSGELADIMSNLNSGKGTLGKLIQDSTIADNLKKTMSNLESSSKGLDDNMEAAKGNILLRGYYKRKEKERLEKIEAATKTK
jgi:phospholipid/cholesterol/gamma-HCH transport system substrate-binding protein